MLGLCRTAFLALPGLAATAIPALAQTYPNRPIRLSVGFPPGSAADIIARLVAQSMSVRLGMRIE